MAAAAADEDAQLRAAAVERVLRGVELGRVADVDAAGLFVSAEVVRGLLRREERLLFAGRHQLQRWLDASPALTLRSDTGSNNCRLWTLNGARARARHAQRAAAARRQPRCYCASGCGARRACCLARRELQARFARFRAAARRRRRQPAACRSDPAAH
jgi:hypothetical protein